MHGTPRLMLMLVSVLAGPAAPLSPDLAPPVSRPWGLPSSASCLLLWRDGAKSPLLGWEGAHTGLHPAHSGVALLSSQRSVPWGEPEIQAPRHSV